MNNEPNFEGEKMKMPSQKVASATADNATSGTKGIFIVVLFIALAVILVGMFYWYNLGEVVPAEDNAPLRPTAEMNKEPETTNAVAEVDSFSALSTSDELSAIEADLESTNLDGLEAELGQVETEIETSVQ
jgi:hypothetical protein